MEVSVSTTQLIVGKLYDAKAGAGCSATALSQLK